jgi:hypothetical protein
MDARSARISSVRWSELNWPEIDALDRDRTVLLLPTGCVELARIVAAEADRISTVDPGAMQEDLALLALIEGDQQLVLVPAAAPGKALDPGQGNSPQIDRSSALGDRQSIRPGSSLW